MKQKIKRWIFALLGKDPEAVVVSFCSGDPELCRRMVEEVRSLVPDRRHFTATPENWFTLRRELKRYRIGLAPVMLAKEASALRLAAYRLAPRKILAYNSRLERHHLGWNLASFLFWRGVPLDRIWLRPRWWPFPQRERTTTPDTIRRFEGRPCSPTRPRAAVLSPYFPYPLSHGGAVRIFNLLREMARDFDVELFAFDSPSPAGPSATPHAPASPATAPRGPASTPPAPPDGPHSTSLDPAAVPPAPATPDGTSATPRDLASVPLASTVSPYSAPHDHTSSATGPLPETVAPSPAAAPRPASSAPAPPTAAPHPAPHDPATAAPGQLLASLPPSPAAVPPPTPHDPASVLPAPAAPDGSSPTPRDLASVPPAAAGGPPGQPRGPASPGTAPAGAPPIDHLAPVLEFCARVVLVEQPRYRAPRWSTLLPPEVHEFRSPAMRRAIDQERRAFGFQALQVEYTQLAEYGGDILVEHDVTFDLYGQIARRNRTVSAWWDFFRWRRFERRALRRFRHAVVMSEKDAAMLGPSVPATVLENGVDLARFQSTTESPGQHLLFIGSFRHFPNISAFRFFLESVWPLLRDKFPDMTVTVVGGPDHLLYWREFTNSPEPPSDSRIQILGFVPDVRPLYDRTNLVIVPTTVSAGTNVKVLEAMAMRRAVISTTSGCAGLGLLHGHSVWVADTPQAFAAGIATLLGDAERRAQIAEAAWGHAHRNFDWQAIGEKLRQLLRRCLEPGH